MANFLKSIFNPKKQLKNSLRTLVKAATAPAAAQTAPGKARGKGAKVKIPLTGNYSANISGESFHLDTLAALAAKHDGPFPVVLHCETNNKHDEFAVAVKAGGKKIGYLPRDDNEDYRGWLLDTHGHLGPAETMATIFAFDTTDSPPRRLYSVKLDLDTAYSLDAD